MDGVHRVQLRMPSNAVPSITAAVTTAVAAMTRNAIAAALLSFPAPPILAPPKPPPWLGRGTPTLTSTCGNDHDRDSAVTGGAAGTSLATSSWITRTCWPRARADVRETLQLRRRILIAFTPQPEAISRAAKRHRNSRM